MCVRVWEHRRWEPFKALSSVVCETASGKGSRSSSTVTAGEFGVSRTWGSHVSHFSGSSIKTALNTWWEDHNGAFARTTAMLTISLGEIGCGNHGRYSEINCDHFGGTSSSHPGHVIQMLTPEVYCYRWYSEHLFSETIIIQHPVKTHAIHPVPLDSELWRRDHERMALHCTMWNAISEAWHHSTGSSQCWSLL